MLRTTRRRRKTNHRSKPSYTLFSESISESVSQSVSESVSQQNTMHRLVFLGAPGVGKGTYAKLICKDLGLFHINPGDMLRKEFKKYPESTIR